MVEKYTRENLPKKGELTREIAALLQIGDEIYFSRDPIMRQRFSLPCDDRPPFNNPKTWYEFLGHKERKGILQRSGKDLHLLIVREFDLAMHFTWFSQYKLKE